jgi:hypothetical protein
MCLMRKVPNMGGRLLSHVPTFHLRRSSTDFYQFWYSGVGLKYEFKSPCANWLHALRTSGGVEVYHARIFNLCTRWSGCQLHIRFTSVSRNEPRRLLDRSECGPQNRPGCDGEQRNFRPCLESNFCGPPRCPVPVPTELRRFIDIMKLPGEFSFGWYRWNNLKLKICIDRLKRAPSHERLNLT